MTNLITRVGWEARLAAHDSRLDFADGPLRDAVNELVDYLLFVDEEPLTATITGHVRFCRQVCRAGPGRPAVADRCGSSTSSIVCCDIRAAT